MKIVVLGPEFIDSFARNICVTLTAQADHFVPPWQPVVAGS
jgi:hypothetical protein